VCTSSKKVVCKSRGDVDTPCWGMKKSHQNKVQGYKTGQNDPMSREQFTLGIWVSR